VSFLLAPPRAELLTFLRAKVADADQAALVRDEMARSYELEMSPDEWKAAMNIHPSTRGTRMPTPEERQADGAVQRRIAAKHRDEAGMYRAILAALGGSD
jgi:hypothetical protein